MTEPVHNPFGGDFAPDPPKPPMGCFAQVFVFIVTLAASTAAITGIAADDKQPAATGEEAASTSTTDAVTSTTSATTTTIPSTEVIPYTATYSGTCEGDFFGEVDVHSEGTVDVYIGGGGGQRQLLGSSPLSSDGAFEVGGEGFTMSGRIVDDEVTGGGEFGGLFSDSDSLISDEPCPFTLSPP